MIFCGEAQGGSASSAGTYSQVVQRLLKPVGYGTTDVDLITGTETFPDVTQSTTFTAGNPDNPLQIVVAYNDTRCRNIGLRRRRHYVYPAHASERLQPLQ